MPRAPSLIIRFRSLLRAVVALVVALALTWPLGRAWADTHASMRAVVVAKDLDAPLVKKLRAELAAQGFESLAVWGPPTAPTATELGSIARGSDARAILRLDDTGRAIEVWLAGADRAAPVLVDTVRASGSDDDTTVAVKAAATLHGALLPTPAPASPSSAPPLLPPLVPVPAPPVVVVVPPAPPASVAPAAPPPAVAVVATPAAPPPPHFARFTLAIGASALASSGGVGPMADLSLAGSWHPVRAWSIGLIGELPIFSSSLTEGATTAHVGATLLGAEVAHAFGVESWKVHPDVAIGGGVASLHLAGNAPSVSVAAPTVDAWMGAAMARAGLAVPIASEWRIRGDAIVGLAFPEADIDFGKTRVATWGRPFGSLGVALEFVLR